MDNRHKPSPRFAQRIKTIYAHGPSMTPPPRDHADTLYDASTPVTECKARGARLGASDTFAKRGGMFHGGRFTLESVAVPFRAHPRMDAPMPIEEKKPNRNLSYTPVQHPRCQRKRKAK